MTRRNAIERREIKISNFEVTPYAIWPLAKSIMKTVRPKAPTAIYGPAGLTSLPSEKTSVIADYLQNQFTPHDLCEENHERPVEALVQGLSEAVYDSPPEKGRPCDVQKLIKSLKLGKVAELMAFQTNAIGTLQEGHWFTYLTIASGCRIFHRLGRKQR
jgi:hypothetical protein